MNTFPNEKPFTIDLHPDFTSRDLSDDEIAQVADQILKSDIVKGLAAYITCTNDVRNQFGRNNILRLHREISTELYKELTK